MTTKIERQPNAVSRLWDRAKANWSADLKAFRMRFSGYGGAPGHYWTRDLGYLPGAAYDYVAAAGDLRMNPVVAICLAWKQRVFVAAKLQVEEQTADGDLQAVPNHPLTELLKRPNADYTGDHLLQATLASYDLDGNAYWIKARGNGGQGRPLELWYVPHWMIRPVWPADGRVSISGYEYRVDGKPFQLAREDVVHFQMGLDLANPRLGFSPMRALLREVATDNEMTIYSAALPRNMGIPGALIAPKSDAFEIDDEGRARLKALWRENTMGEARGGVIIPSFPVDVTPLGISPKDLDITSMRQVSEDRICAAHGISPMVANLTSGAAHKTYANYREAREAANDDTIVPTQETFAQTIENELLHVDFDPKRQYLVGWDRKKVKIEQPDVDAQAKRAVEVYKAGVATLNEARSILELPEVPDGDAFAPKPQPLGQPPKPDGEAEEEPAIPFGGNGNGQKPKSLYHAEESDRILQAVAALVGGAEEKYSPSQPRDREGQWTDTGAGTAASLRPATDAERAALKVPPAWTDVRINDDPTAALQVVGRDKAGREQRRYSAAHTEAASVNKFARGREFDRQLPDIEKRFNADFDGSGPNKDSAAALYLIHKTGFRPGSDAETGARTKAYGATTLRREHVKVEGDTVRFDFIGKEGVRQQHALTDGRVARDIERRLATGNERLFATNDAKVRDYLKSIDGEFKVKDFRTWTGTSTALRAVQDIPAPKTRREYNKQRLEVGRRVAQKLGNRPQQALESYIDPRVFGGWEAGLNDG